MARPSPIAGGQAAALLAQFAALPEAGLPSEAARDGIDVLRVVASLLVVLAVLALLAALARKLSLGGRTGELAVEHRIPVTRGGHLAIVRAGARRLLVGVTGTQVSLITELDEAPAEPPPARAGRFERILGAILARPAGGAS